MATSLALRKQLTQLLTGEEAHASFDRAVDDLPAALRGEVPPGLPYSPWQLLEHLRIAQRDILDYCIAKDYVAPSWPQDYWPSSPAPPNASAWKRSVAAFRRDRDAFVALVNDQSIDLVSPVPSNKTHTLLREVLLVADHNAYHVGQLMYVRRLLGAPAAS